MDCRFGLTPIRPASFQSPRLTDIDALRGIAVAMVLLAHVPGGLIWPPPDWSVPFSSIFAVGVEIFFTISGFVIGRSLLPAIRRGAMTGARWPVIRGFWLRRAARLLPAACLWLLIPFVLSLVFNKIGWFDTPEANFYAALAGIFDASNFLLAYRMSHGLVSGPTFHYWSLSLEEQFYFIAPFVILLPQRMLTIVLLLAIPIICLAKGPYAGVLRVEDILAGLALAAVETASGRFQCNNPPDRWVRWSLGILSGAILVLIMRLSTITPYFLPGWFTVFWAARLGIAAASTLLVYIAALDCGLLVGRGRAYRILLWLGRRSYSIYLVHICAFTAAKELMGRLGFADDVTGLSGAIVTLFGFALVIGFAQPTYHLIERHRPAIPQRWRDRQG